MASDLVIRARKFISNNLLDRKQFILDIYHLDATDLSKKTIAKVVADKFKVSDEQVVIFGTKIKFGGGRSTAFCLIYNSLDSRMKFEPKHRLYSSGLLEQPKNVKKRKTKKDEKNRMKKLRGKAKNAIRK